MVAYTDHRPLITIGSSMVCPALRNRSGGESSIGVPTDKDWS